MTEIGSSNLVKLYTVQDLQLMTELEIPGTSPSGSRMVLGW